MKKGWLLIPLIGVVATLAWLLAEEKIDTAGIRSALGMKSASAPSQAKSKPLCSQVVVPAGDCIPQHLANLPPDPGPAGKLTIEGIDADKNGVRDDVQRYIAEKWGHSPRAVKVLTTIAVTTQLQVKYGDELGREESRKFAPAIMNAGRCYSQLATPEMEEAQALGKIQNKVTNTPERYKRARAFSYMLAHNVYPFGDESPAELCGFDPAAYPN